MCLFSRDKLNCVWGVSKAGLFDDFALKCANILSEINSNNLLFRWFRCPKEGQAVSTLWPVPCVCQPQSSWAVGGALECVCGRATAKASGKMNPAHLGLQGWGLVFYPGQETLNYECIMWWRNMYIVLNVVLSTDGSSWWSNRVNIVRIWVPVTVTTFYHLQNSPGSTGADCVLRDSTQKQQHTVSSVMEPVYTAGL